MLNKLRKVFNSEQQEEVMETNQTQTEASVPYAEMAALRTSYMSQQTELQAMLAAKQALEAELKGFKEAAQVALEQVKAVKMAARKAAVEASLGTEKSVAVLAATESLDDAQFESIVSAMATTLTKEADTSLFKEVGVDAKADASKAETESLEMQMLIKQHSVK